MRIGLIVVNAILAVLVLVLIAHLWHAPTRWQAVESSQRDQAKALERLSQSLDKFGERLDQVNRSQTSQSNHAQQEALQALRDQQQEMLQLLQKGVRLADDQQATQAKQQGDDGPKTTVQDIKTPPEEDVVYGDGKAVLGKNFLLPYDDSHFNPELVGGTWNRFGSSPKRLNDILESSATTSDINSLVNDSLCRRDLVDVALWRSSLATSVVIENDWKKFTFKIRKGVTWQIPRIAYGDDSFAWLRQRVPLTAHDFAFYLEMIVHPQTECPQEKVYYKDLGEVEVPDDHTLIINWKKKNYTNIASSLDLDPLPRHVYTKNADGSEIPAADVGIRFNKHWFDERHQLIGVGRFSLDDFVFDNSIRFKRNADYWGKTLHFDFLNWNLVIQDPTSRLTAFKNGQVLHSSLTPIQFKTNVLDHSEKRFAAYDPSNPKAGRSGELAWEIVKAKAYSHVGWNMRLPLFQDKRVRQALTHAFPKQRIIKEVYYNLGRPQIANLHIDSPYSNKDLKDYEFNLNKARELLVRAGWEDTDGDGVIDKEINGERIPFAFTIKHYDNSPEWDGTLAIYKAELKKLGISMTPRSLRWPDLVKTYEDQDFEAVSGGWRLGGDPDFYQLWHSAEADKLQSSNYCGFKNAEADALAEKLRATFDLDERIRIAKAFQAIIHEEQPYTFFRSSEGVFSWQNSGPNKLKGVEYGLDHNHPFNATSQGRWHLEGP